MRLLSIWRRERFVIRALTQQKRDFLDSHTSNHFLIKYSNQRRQNFLKSYPLLKRCNIKSSEKTAIGEYIVNDLSILSSDLDIRIGSIWYKSSDKAKRKAYETYRTKIKEPIILYTQQFSDSYSIIFDINNPLTSKGIKFVKSDYLPVSAYIESKGRGKFLEFDKGRWFLGKNVDQYSLYYVISKKNLLEILKEYLPDIELRKHALHYLTSEFLGRRDSTLP